MPMCSGLFPSYFSITFSVSGFMWMSLIHLDLSLVQGDRKRAYGTYGEGGTGKGEIISILWNDLKSIGIRTPLYV